MPPMRNRVLFVTDPPQGNNSSGRMLPSWYAAEETTNGGQPIWDASITQIRFGRNIPPAIPTCQRPVVAKILPGSASHLPNDSQPYLRPDHHKTVRIKLYDASERSHSGSLVVWRGFTIGAARTAPGGIIRGKTFSAISGRPDIPCFLLLGDPANELLLTRWIGHRSHFNPSIGRSSLTRMVDN
jgi:hypothetical protein